MAAEEKPEEKPDDVVKTFNTIVKATCDYLLSIFPPLYKIIKKK